MKVLFTLVLLSLANLTHATIVPVDCNPKEVMCKYMPCTAWIPKSVGTISSSTCSKVFSSPYVEGPREWTFLYYELEVLSTVNDRSGKMFATKIRLKDI